jgi:hypothetical protein
MEKAVVFGVKCMMVLGLAASLAGCASPVMVSSTPSGADVVSIYGGGSFGTTPVRLPGISFLSGPRSYEVKKDGYVPKEILIARTSPEMLKVELEKEIQRVAVSSKPSSVDVYDETGGMIGQTPIAIAVTNVQQSYELKKLGYESKVMTLTASSPKELEVDMGKPISGMILMEIVPGDNALQVKSSMVFSEKDVIERSPNVRAVRRLTDFSPTRWVGGFCIFPDGKKLLMDILDKESTTGLTPVMFSNLWALDLTAAGGLVRWSEGKYFDKDPSFSEDGAFVYFASSRAGKNAIFRMSINNLKGLGMVTPGSTSDSFPQVSPGGENLMWTAAMGGSDIPQLWSMPLSKGLPSGLPMQIREGSNPRWSPKGDLILYTSVDRNLGKTKIWTMTPDGERPTQLTTGSNCNDIDPFWFPDGSKIIYASDLGVSNGRQNFDIWVMDADGAHPQQLTTNGSRDDHPVISADGKTVCFRSNRGYKWDVWVMEIAGTKGAQ